MGLLVGSRQWPLLAARMDRIRDQGSPALLGAHLGRLQADTTWKDGPSSTTVGRLVDVTLRSLTTPPSTPAAPASRVTGSPAAARSRSAITLAAAPPGELAPAEAAVSAHCQQAVPAKTLWAGPGDGAALSAAGLGVLPTARGHAPLPVRPGQGSGMEPPGRAPGGVDGGDVGQTARWLCTRVATSF
ncbi:hypothetical protein ACFVQ9_37195 [Streptomyces goshikiensis]|uniref:hypothetical protein n=1 Tax=Streptomyces goshikiensis TaxID=1942 RepID=UPI0036929E35